MNMLACLIFQRVVHQNLTQNKPPVAVPYRTIMMPVQPISSKTQQDAVSQLLTQKGPQHETISRCFSADQRPEHSTTSGCSNTTKPQGTAESSQSLKSAFLASAAWSVSQQMSQQQSHTKEVNTDRNGPKFKPTFFARKSASTKLSKPLPDVKLLRMLKPAKLPCAEGAQRKGLKSSLKTGNTFDSDGLTPAVHHQDSGAGCNLTQRSKTIFNLAPLQHTERASSTKYMFTGDKPAMPQQRTSTATQNCLTAAQLTSIYRCNQNLLDIDIHLIMKFIFTKKHFNSDITGKENSKVVR